MAWFDSNRKNLGFMAPPPAFVDSNGVKYSVVDYSAPQRPYVAETEQYKGAPTILQKYDDKLNPKNLGLRNGHGRREGQLLYPFGPWSSAREAKLDGKISSMDQADHRFWNPTRDHELKRGGQSPPRALVGHQYKKGDEFSTGAQVISHQPWSHDDDLKKDDEFSPKPACVQADYNANKGSTHGTYEPTRGSPRARDDYDSPSLDHGKYNNCSDESDDDDYGDVSDDDDVVCEDGVCYRKEGTKLGHSYPKDNHSDPQLTKLAGARVDRYSWRPARYENLNKSKIPIAESHFRRELREEPHFGTRSSAYDNDLTYSLRRPQISTPWSVVASPCINHNDQGGRGEERGNYGSTSPHRGVHVQKRYGRIIDSKIAAEKYNGIILPI